MNNTIEEWRDITGYLGIYQVSSLGRVKSLKFDKEISMKLMRCENGYLRVNLSKCGKKKTFKIHQLVAQAFLGHVINGYAMVINHINNIKTDNRVENLEVVTPRENTSTCARKNTEIFTSKYVNICWNNRINKWAGSIAYQKKQYHLGYFENEKEAYSKSQTALLHIKNGTFDNYINELRDKKFIKINQYNKLGEFLREWNSATIASKELNINRGAVNACCRGLYKSAGGFKWEYLNSNKINSI